jgi:chemotaxis response regulator CheB
MAKIRNVGVITIAKEESTAIVYEILGEAIETGGTKIVLPCYKMRKS